MGIDWTHGAGHMMANHGVTVTEASEALSDPSRIEFRPDPASKSGASDRTIGWSQTAGAVLVVITVDEDGTTYGVNGWHANNSAKRIYREGNEQ